MKQANKTFQIHAPIGGIIVPLEDVPDPVFSQKLAGDGMAIDPTDNLLRAPCDGTVSQLHRAGHAIAIQVPEGPEILMHIGLDTVTLNGRGFAPKVQLGDTVRAGTPLIMFDLDYVATYAKSALVLVLQSSKGRITSRTPLQSKVEGGKSTLFSCSLGDTAAAEVTTGGIQRNSVPIRIVNPTGLHARPAAVLAAEARAFQSKITLQVDGRSANAKSVTSLMSLDVRKNAMVTLCAEGHDAAQAVTTLSQKLRDGLGEGCGSHAAVPTGPAVAATVPENALADVGLFEGIPASPGVGLGTLVQLRKTTITVKENSDRPECEAERLHVAIEKAREQLKSLETQLRSRDKDGGEADIFAAHVEILEDPELVDAAKNLIGQGKTAAFAWRAASQAQSEILCRVKNPLLAQRAQDIQDVCERVLAALTGEASSTRTFPKGSILIAEELAPSQTAELDPSHIAGFCTVRGGASSHAAILARSLGIPAIAAMDSRVLELQDGTPAFVDGHSGRLELNPSPELVRRVRQIQSNEESARAADLSHALEPAITLDGSHVEITANVGNLRDARKIASFGAEGVGLLRTEFLFMDRATAPSEEEQYEIYRKIILAVGTDKPLSIRTLDAGGDKPLDYLPIAPEANPFLGVRGIRIGLDQPEILRTQVRAVLRAASKSRARLMFPMVATLHDLRRAKKIVAQESELLGAPAVPIGIMVEVPSVAVMAKQFAEEADFFSIGTNDLTQYTLAMDRGNSKLARRIDSFDPAILLMIERCVNGAHSCGKPVGVCGGMASDAEAIPLLIGLGVDELSVSLSRIPAVKAQIRTLKRMACEQMAQSALACATAEDVHALIAESGLYKNTLESV